MKFTTPVSMPCTEAQYNELKPLLEAMGYEVRDVFGNRRTHINTNATDIDSIVEYGSDACKYGQILLPTYNKDLFLAIAAMTDEPNGIAGEWWKCLGSEKTHFSNNKLYRACRDRDSVCNYFMDNNNYPSGKYDASDKCFTKATVAEIFAHFGVSYGKEQAKPIQPEIPQPKPMLQIKQIDDNTYSINGRTFKHTGEDVRSPMEQNVAEVKYTKDYCWKNRVAIACLDAIEWEAALGLYNSNVAKENEDEWLVYREKSCFSFDNGEFGFGSTGYYRGAGYTIIPAATFITHNTQQQDEVLFVTEDGVSIRRGDNIWCIDNECSKPWEWVDIPKDLAEYINHDYKGFKAFSTRQAAQAHFDSQKPKVPTLAEDSKFEISLLDLVKCMTDNEEAQDVLYDKFKAVFEANKG